MPRKLLTPALGTILALALALPIRAQSPACSGDMNKPHPHPYGPFNFETNSRREPITASQFKFKIISCVRNPDPNNYLSVRWLIPGPKAYVPRNDILDSQPRRTTEETSPELEGCLEYGDRGDTRTAPFYGLATDVPDVANEKTHGCRAAAARVQREPAQSGGLRLENFFDLFRIFLPSDTQKPSSTMLELEGAVGVKVISATSYISSFAFKVRPHGENEGSAANVTIRPNFQGSAEPLLAAFRANNRDTTRLNQVDALTFEVSEIVDPHFRYASYGLYDQNEKLVAEVDLPIFVN